MPSYAYTRQKKALIDICRQGKYVDAFLMKSSVIKISLKADLDKPLSAYTNQQSMP